MNWVGIAQFESNKVADWIKFMIRHDRYELGPVLNGVVQTLITLPIQDPKSPIPASAGNAYLKTGVPMLLLELVCDPAMYARFSPSGYRVNSAVAFFCRHTLTSNFYHSISMLPSSASQ